jgi:hypothetical protein
MRCVWASSPSSAGYSVAFTWQEAGPPGHEVKNVKHMLSVDDDEW